MVELIPPPDPHGLLPPLLACLPTAFASSRPPPALLPLLSPILSQRLQMITSTSSTNDNWLRLLCWDNEKADAVRDVVENANFEPHPASGELEVGEVDPLTYKRFDQETLRAQIPLPDWNLCAMYLWCAGDKEAGGWKLAELLPYEEARQESRTWSSTISAANESSRERLVSEALQEADRANLLAPPVDDDDDYWAMYDKSPGGRTPARKASIAPNGNHSSDADYYAQYGDVQPAMDNEDPSEAMEDAGGSTLNGNTLSSILNSQPEQEERGPPAYHESYDPSREVEDEQAMPVSQPHPSSPSTTGSDTVARLEKTAERYAASEIGIKQHIGTSIKSMYRLARSAGMDREEFTSIVQREMETLSMLERDD